jgi:hypothetical protein
MRTRSHPPLRLEKRLQTPLKQLPRMESLPLLEKLLRRWNPRQNHSPYPEHEITTLIATITGRVLVLTLATNPRMKFKTEPGLATTASPSTKYHSLILCPVPRRP